MVASIEYIERTIENYQKATQANLETPGREGTVDMISAEIADEVMITGDLHGHRRNFTLIQRIADLANHPRRHLILQEVCHGGPTYPQNGGCMSHTMLENVAKLKVEFPDQVHFILGNHELSELTEYPIQKNKQMLNLLFRLGLQQMYGPATEKVREAYLPFFESCPLAVRMPGGIFISHSIPEQVDPKKFDSTIFARQPSSMEYLERGSIFNLVWGRDYSEENAEKFAKIVDATILINGHEPCPEQGFRVPNDYQVIIDGCNDTATYLLLPVKETWTQEEVVEQIQNLK
ncbi:MAG: metallophosphoesterase [Planctomycetia bacterium]|jgi:hypothetical protein